MICILIGVIGVVTRAVRCLVTLLVPFVVVIVIVVVVISFGSNVPFLFIILCHRNIILVVEESQMGTRAFSASGSNAWAKP